MNISTGNLWSNIELREGMIKRAELEGQRATNDKKCGLSAYVRPDAHYQKGAKNVKG